MLRGELAKGGGEILLRTPPKYVVPNHSHTSDEVYVWLKGSFTYVAADGSRQKMTAPAYISLPGQTPHALECGDEHRVSRSTALVAELEEITGVAVSGAAPLAGSQSQF